MALTALIALSPGFSHPAFANATPAHTPPTEIQSWTVNIEHLTKIAWDAFVHRMQTNEFGPDIILVQEVTATEANTFASRVRNLLGSHYTHLTSTGENAVVWNTERFTRLGSHEWAQTGSCGNGKTGMAVNLRDEAATAAFLEYRNVVAASIHFRTDGSNACLRDAWQRANNALDSWVVTRRMTVLGGDVNRKPDTHDRTPTNNDETIAEGLGTDPMCWYRQVSAGHGNNLVTGEECSADGSYFHDRYHDTVWTYAASGGGTNPTSAAFCEQFTRVNVFNLPSTQTNGPANSCSDVNGDGQLDKNRIDYIWTSYERAGGAAWHPPSSTIAAHIAYAGADLGISLDATDDLGMRYSDHRAVQALLTWPATMP